MRQLLFLIAILSVGTHAYAAPIVMVQGRNFSVPATQEINFVPVKVIEPVLYLDKDLPRVIDLKAEQSSVKSQGKRGACTYFAITGLIESLIKKETGREVDISEEYLAWAAKVKKKLRPFEEDSSVAVNAATIQDFGFMLEEDLPYQPSWFDKGLPCEGKKGTDNIDPVCFSHSGPDAKMSKQIIPGHAFVFEAINSSSIDVVRALARLRSPVHISILGHRWTWEHLRQGGEMILTPELKEECQRHTAPCGGHAVIVVGYDLNKKVFTFKNSWGAKAGDSGYGTISFDYLDQLSDRKFITGRLEGKLVLPDRQ